MTEEQKILDIFAWNYAPTITCDMDDAELDAIYDAMTAEADGAGMHVPLGLMSCLREMRSKAMERMGAETERRLKI